MPFPFSIRGSVPISDEAANLSDDAIIIACVDQVEHERARVVSHTDHSTSFTVPFLSWGSNWRFTVPLSGGSLEIMGEPAGGRRLSYNFSTRRVALIGTLAIIGLFVVVASRGVGQFPWWVPFVGWLWLVGGNYFISFVRAPRWVRRRISDAVKVSAALAVPRPNKR
jgi:hypothetical protein